MQGEGSRVRSFAGSEESSADAILSLGAVGAAPCYRAGATQAQVRSCPPHPGQTSPSQAGRCNAPGGTAQPPHGASRSPHGSGKYGIRGPSRGGVGMICSTPRAPRPVTLGPLGRRR